MGAQGAAGVPVLQLDRLRQSSRVPDGFPARAHGAGNLTVAGSMPQVLLKEYKFELGTAPTANFFFFFF